MQLVVRLVDNKSATSRSKWSLGLAEPDHYETRKGDDAECRHDMRPSVQLPSVSGVDSKLGRGACHDYARQASFFRGF